MEFLFFLGNQKISVSFSVNFPGFWIKKISKFKNLFEISQKNKNLVLGV
jgi:hypothetical protein